jgi:hypothetical protein
MTSSISIYAGKNALLSLHEQGLSSDLIQVVAAASGGPKWFTLFGLDKYLFGDFFSNRTKPLYTIGSSIGSWRMACFAQNDPVAAITRLAYSYANEHYSNKPTSEEISRKADVLLTHVLGQNGVKEIIENNLIQSHFLVSRAKGLCANENKLLQMLGLAGAATLNAFSRKLLKVCFERYIFYTAHANTAFSDSYFNIEPNNTQLASLDEHNLQRVLSASAAIPLLLQGVKGIDTKSQDVFRDGGIIDYHLDIDFGHKGLTLYPHFQPLIKPGWFDKNLPYRHANKNHFDNVIIITPSPSHIAKLPYGKISDRRDFTELDTPQRYKYWNIILDESERMADDFARLVDTGQGLEHTKAIELIL